MAESEEGGHTAKIRFSPVHKGHVDGNKRVDGEKVDSKEMHHQDQGPGYDGKAADVPVRHSGG